MFLKKELQHCFTDIHSFISSLQLMNRIRTLLAKLKLLLSRSDPMKAQNVLKIVNISNKNRIRPNNSDLITIC